MSYIQSLVNQNSSIEISAITTPTQSGATSISLTMHGWPSFALLDSLIVFASNALSASITVNVSNNSAMYKANGYKLPASAFTPQTFNTVNDAYLIASSGTVNISNELGISFSNAYVEDMFQSDCLYLTITSTGFPTGTVFKVIARGTPQTYDKSIGYERYAYNQSAQVPFINDPSWRIINVNAAGVGTDLSTSLRRGGNPYRLGPVNISENFPALSSSNDYLYIGSARQWLNALILLPPVYQNNLPGTIQYYNGSSWVTANAQDNTSDLQTNQSTLSYSGVLSIPSWSGISAFKLAQDPLTILENNINDPTQHYPSQGGFFYNPPRYWARINVPSLVNPINLVGVLPL